MVQPNRTICLKLEYVGQVGQGEGGLQILLGQVEQGEGVFRSSWDKWDKDKGSVHSNHSTCPKWDYKVPGSFTLRDGQSTTFLFVHFPREC